MKSIYLIIPLLSALVGWGTNLLAVRMLFRPYTPRYFLGFKLHGLIPRRQSELAVKISQTVEEELLSTEDIKQIASSPENIAAIVGMLERELEDNIFQTLRKIPLASSLLDSSLPQTIKRMQLEYLKRKLPQLMSSILERMDNKIEFRSVVCKKIENYDFHELEAIIYRIAAKELKAIEYWGGLIGFLVGVIQVILLIGLQGWT